jgi:hypothetical protein
MYATARMAQGSGGSFFAIDGWTGRREFSRVVGGPGRLPPSRNGESLNQTECTRGSSHPDHVFPLKVGAVRPEYAAHPKPTSPGI